MDPNPPSQPLSTHQERSSLQATPTIPPAPPLPPPRSTKVPRNTSTTSQPPRAPPSASNALSANTTLLTHPARPFRPCPMFFYGTLMDPDVLQALLNLTAPPTTTRASISGFQIKMWGIYPALLSSTSGTVNGVVWRVESEEQFEKLAAYETRAYDWVECDASLQDGGVVRGCRAFCWAGRGDSAELEEGGFDLGRWQRYFKGSVVRRREGRG